MKLLWNTHRRIKYALISAFCVVFAFGDLRAETNVWEPSPGHMQILIWPGSAPDAEPAGVFPTPQRIGLP